MFQNINAFHDIPLCDHRSQVRCVVSEHFITWSTLFEEIMNSDVMLK
jgi:hypothetical protein